MVVEPTATRKLSIAARVHMPLRSCSVHLAGWECMFVWHVWKNACKGCAYRLRNCNNAIIFAPQRTVQRMFEAHTDQLSRS